MGFTLWSPAGKKTSSTGAVEGLADCSVVVQLPLDGCAQREQLL